MGGQQSACSPRTYTEFVGWMDGWMGGMMDG